MGSTLVPLLLEKGHHVRVLDSLVHGGQGLLGVWNHPRFCFIRGDVRDADTTRDAVAGVNAVVHLAAIVGDPACARQPEIAKNVNLEASLQLIETSKRSGVSRFIFASTCSNYGRMADPQQYADESSPLAPVSLYAETKVAVEQYLLKQNADELCATPLRFATVFGVSPRMRFDLTVNEFTMEMLTKRNLVVFGEQFWRPYVHVHDAAIAISMVLEKPVEQVRGQVFNVGNTTQNYQKKQLVELISRHEPDAEIRYVSKQEDPRDYRVCFSKISEGLGYRTNRTVPDGIEEVARLVRSGVVSDFDHARYRN